MSAAKMVADSTQGDLLETSTTKKRKKLVQKKKVKKRKESNKKSKKKSSEDEFDESDLDLDKEVHPIGYYVKDRENLLEQMFHCVKSHSLKRALPDVLKDLPLDELKRRCMEQLEVMSKKRIRRILAGDDPALISSSGTEEDTSEEELLELEEGEVDQESTGGQFVDSTSVYSTLDPEDSDQELLDEEGQESPNPTDNEDPDSVSQDTLSPYASEEEQNDQEENENRYDSNEEDMAVEDAEHDAVHTEGPDELKQPGTPEEPEEGEVIDDEEGDNEFAGESKHVFQMGSENLNNKKGGKSDKVEEVNLTEKESGAQVNKDSQTIFQDQNAKITGDTTAEECKDSDFSETKDTTEAFVSDNAADATENNSVGDNTKQDKENLVTDSVSSADNSSSNDSTTNEIKQTDWDARILKSSSEVEETIRQKARETLDVDIGEDAIEVDDDHIIDEEATNIEREYSVESRQLSVANSENIGNSENSNEGKWINTVSNAAGTSQSNVWIAVTADGSDTKAAKLLEYVSATSGVKDKQTAAEAEAEAARNVEKGKQPERTVRPPKHDIAPALTKNQMELLELEMRARAIKSMLKNAK